MTLIPSDNLSNTAMANQPFFVDFQKKQPFLGDFCIAMFDCRRVRFLRNMTDEKGPNRFQSKLRLDMDQILRGNCWDFFCLR